MFADRPSLADELIEALTGDNAISVRVRIDAMVFSGRPAIDRHLVSDRLAISAGSEHQMKVTRVKTEIDASVLIVKAGVFRVDSPVSGKAPFIEARCRGRIDMR
jgi:hypothetical protein